MELTLKTGQRHENDAAFLIIVCAPSALSKMMGSLHPAGALYQKPVNLRRARDDHAAFVTRLRQMGVEVRDVRSILTERVDWSVGDRIELENMAFNCLTYEFRNPDAVDPESCETCYPRKTENRTEDAQEFYVSDKYKRQVIEGMGVQQLVDIIFTNPTVTVSPSPRDTGFIASYKFDPLSNIVFVRDQQITTRKGIVMARLRSPQRQREIEILEFCFKKLGLNVIGRIPAPAHLEGGDFFPAGEKLSLIGIGPRSDWNAVKFLLEQDLFGTETVAVVKDEFEKKQERMHLDTVFNILSSNCCLMLEDMMGVDSPTKRMVDEYVRYSAADTANTNVDKRTGNYVLHRQNVELSAYMESQGFNIIAVPGEQQLNYGCNILNLGAGNVICTDQRTARQIANSSYFQGRVQYLNFMAVTSMYGGVHCASQVVVRGTANMTKSASQFERSMGNGVAATTYTDDRPNGNSGEETD